MVLSMAVPRVTYALAREEAGINSRTSQSGPLAFFCAPSSPLWYARERRAAANWDGASGACAGRLRPDTAFIIFSAVVFLALTVATLFRTSEQSDAGGFRWRPSSSSSEVACSP